MASSSNSQQSANAPISVPSPANSNANNVKSEPRSPRNENFNSENNDEENSSNNCNNEMNMALSSSSTISTIFRYSTSSNNGSDLPSDTGNTTHNLEDITFGKTSKNSNQNNVNVNVKEEQNGKTLSDSSSFNIKIKIEADCSNNLTNIKKEEKDVSPVMSPLGFGSIGEPIDNAVSGITQVKEEKAKSDKNASTGNEENSAPAKDSLNDLFGGSDSSGLNKTGSTVPGPLGNCMDNMQQQNLIYVFSTQMANKAAESVLNRQHPNLIAYHCTQPETKSFLNDFYTKNPKMKMLNQQHQNSLNMLMSSGGGGGVDSKTLPKVSQKSNASKNKVDSKTQRPLNNAGFTESSDDLTNEHELMKMLEGVDPSGGGGGGDSNIPSLQGVKVPDENLTPQQRQHREEQLAKLTKMNRFLFPESGTGAPDTSQSVGKLNPESISGNSTASEKGITTQIRNPLNQHMRNKNQNKSAMSDLPSDIMNNLMGPAGVMPPNLENEPQPSRMGAGGMQLPDIPQMGMDWSKMQHQFFDENLKGNSNSASDSTGMGVNSQSNTAGNTTDGANPTLRSASAHGLPPPYHAAQRCASVPIATQSPNPSSPGNINSHISLPSPRTPLGIPPTTTSTTNTSNSNTSTQVKSNLQLDGSPSNGNCSGNNSSRNRGGISQQHSNPSTPQSHLSPKDLDPDNLKNVCPSPKDSRSHLESMEGRLPVTSPGLNFPTHNQMTSMNAAKAIHPIERHRTDNVPLNPNSNRAIQNKLSHAVDPISSLAQMSQQLTSNVPLNIGGGSAGNVMGLIGPNDSKMSSNVYPNMENVMSLDGGGMDANNQAGICSMGMPPQINATGPFMSNNSQMNPMFGPMGQRMVNPKMSLESGGHSGIRDGGPSGQFHAAMPPAQRMMNRMSVNNIQVKASTPNTIQYMPIRPQNNNPNTNMRAQPPSLEFLQRYANPQMAGAGIGMDNNSPMGHGNAINSSDSNKLTNNMPGGAGTSAMGGFMQGHNRMGALSMAGNSGGYMLPTHDINMGGGGHPALLRGMRPNMMQQNIGPGSYNPASRMQAPPGAGLNIGGGSVMPQFLRETLERTDTAAAMFGGPETGDGPGPMYAQGQQSFHPKGQNSGQVPPNAMMPSLSGNVPGGQLGPNSNMIQNSKYAQQYHSFQQQLYATSTRAQQQQQQQGSGNPNIGNNANMNPTFFMNK